MSRESTGDCLPSTFLHSGVMPMHNHLKAAASQVICGDLNVESTVQLVGGSALGYLVAGLFADHFQQVDMPSWTIVGPTDRTSPHAVELAANIVARWNSLLIKQSHAQESFTKFSARGANTSRGAHSRNISQDSILELVSSFEPRANARALILQGLVDQDSNRGAAHVYTSTALVECELVFGDQRYYARRTSSTEEWEVSDGRLATSGVRADQMRAILRIGEQFAHWVNVRIPSVREWNIEGEWDNDSEKFWIFQARPAPGDRPSSELNKIFHTSFTWGVFDIRLRRADGAFEPVDQNTAVVTISDNVGREDAMREVERLQREKTSVLVIDSVSAFRLSHESTHLIGTSSRQRYNYLHVPQTVLRSIQDGITVHFSSDGDHASVLCS